MDKINAVVVGLNFGEWVIENELINGKGKDYIKLIGVCDLNKEKTLEFSKRYNVTPYYDLESALASDETQAIILITGPVGRAKIIQKILDAKIPVMTTKPFDTSSKETLDVLNRAKAEGVTVFMNSPTPLASGELLQMEKWIEEFALGRTIGYRASTYCSYREKPDGSWYDDEALCPAAPVFRLGIYLLNDLCRFLSPVERVDVIKSRIFTVRPTADNAMLSILHEDGTIGGIYASFCIDDLQYYRCSMEINFEHGTIYKNVGLKTSDDVELSLSANINGQRVVKQCIIKAEGGYQWKNFYDAINGDLKEQTVEPAQVASVIKILEDMKLEKDGQGENND